MYPNQTTSQYFEIYKRSVIKRFLYCYFLFYTFTTKLIKLHLFLRRLHRWKKDSEREKFRTLNSAMAALQYLESLRNDHPELSDWYTTLADLYERKLWHQLSLKLEQFVALAVFQVLYLNISIFYSHFIVFRDFRFVIN